MSPCPGKRSVGPVPEDRAGERIEDPLESPEVRVDPLAPRHHPRAGSSRLGMQARERGHHGLGFGHHLGEVLEELRPFDRGERWSGPRDARTRRTRHAPIDESFGGEAHRCIVAGHGGEREAGVAG
jgi:hypothetical protein